MYCYDSIFRFYVAFKDYLTTANQLKFTLSERTLCDGRD